MLTIGRTTESSLKTHICYGRCTCIGSSLFSWVFCFTVAQVRQGMFLIILPLAIRDVRSFAGQSETWQWWSWCLFATCSHRVMCPRNGVWYVVVIHHCDQLKFIFKWYYRPTKKLMKALGNIPELAQRMYLKLLGYGWEINTDRALWKTWRNSVSVFN